MKLFRDHGPTGGGRRIRTFGRITASGFQDQRIRPLCHAPSLRSPAWIIRSPGRTSTLGMDVRAVALYGASALYHLLPVSPAAVARLRRLDHGTIFILIAGTYTPSACFGGSLVYSAGALVYGLELPNLIPGVFGFHELWHLFVLAGSACHFWAMLQYIAPIA